MEGALALTQRSDGRLLDYVKALENRDNRSRGDAVLGILAGHGIGCRIQGLMWPRVKNIVVDFRQGGTGEYAIFSAHYDAVKGCPGANDNASGVAVLLGLCSRLKPPAPIKVVFFDREENWLRGPLLQLGLLGSTCFVLRNSLRGLKAVYNIDCCGVGDLLAVWPVKGKQGLLPAVAAARSAAGALNIACRTAHLPWLLHSSDHLSFRLRGIENAVTLSLVPAGAATALRDLIGSVSPASLLSGRRPQLPEPLSRLHTPRDRCEHLSEAALQLMLGVAERLATRAPELKACGE